MLSPALLSEPRMLVLNIDNNLFKNTRFCFMPFLWAVLEAGGSIAPPVAFFSIIGIHFNLHDTNLFWAWEYLWRLLRHFWEFKQTVLHWQGDKLRSCHANRKGAIIPLYIMQYDSKFIWIVCSVIRHNNIRMPVLDRCFWVISFCVMWNQTSQQTNHKNPSHPDLDSANGLLGVKASRVTKAKP